MSAAERVHSLLRPVTGMLGYHGLSRRARGCLRREMFGYPLLAVVDGLAGGGFVASLAFKSMGAAGWMRDLLVATPMIAMLGSLLWSAGSPRRRKPLVLLPAAGAAVLLGCIGLVGNAFVLLPVLLGIHWLLSSVTVNRAHIWRQNYSADQRGRAVARVMTASFLMAAAVGATASIYFHWLPGSYHAVYPVGAAYVLLGVWALARLRVHRQNRDHARHTPQRFRLADALRLLREDPIYRGFSACQMATGFGNMMCSVIAVSLLNDTLAANWIELGLVLTVLPIVGRLAAVAFWARANDRVHPLKMRAATGIGWVVCRLIFLAAVFARSMPLMYLMSAASGVTESGSSLSWHLTVGYIAPRRQVSRYMSLHVFLTGIRGLIAPLLGGFLFTHVMGDWTVVLALGILAGGAVGFLRLAARYGRNDHRDGLAEKVGGAEAVES